MGLALIELTLFKLELISPELAGCRIRHISTSWVSGQNEVFFTPPEWQLCSISLDKKLILFWISLRIPPSFPMSRQNDEKNR